MATETPICTHVKTDGNRCGSPAVKGTELCFHHSAANAGPGKAGAAGEAADGGFAPIPFAFPEDRVAMQINYFLLLQALNEKRIDLRTCNAMLRMLRAMDKNLGITGSLTVSGEASQQAGDSAAEALSRPSGVPQTGSPSGLKPGSDQQKREAQKQEPAKPFNASKIAAPHPARMGKLDAKPAINLAASATGKPSTTGPLLLDEITARPGMMQPEYFPNAAGLL